LDVGNAIFDNPMSCRPPSIIIKTGVEHVLNLIAAQPSFFLAVFSFPCSLAPLLLVPAPFYEFQAFGAVPEGLGCYLGAVVLADEIFHYYYTSNRLVISSGYYTMVLKSYVSSDATEESLERDTDRDLGVLTTPDDEA
jgi:hypothetical protein